MKKYIFAVFTYAIYFSSISQSFRMLEKKRHAYIFILLDIFNLWLNVQLNCDRYIENEHLHLPNENIHFHWFYDNTIPSRI